MSYSSEMLRGNTETIILAILIQGDSYGWAILKEINTRSKGVFDIKDATIYTTIRKMENEALITTYWGEESQTARRKYYKITEEGKKYYYEKVEEWRVVKHALVKLIEGDDTDEQCCS